MVARSPAARLPCACSTAAVGPGLPDSYAYLDTARNVADGSGDGSRRARWIPHSLPSTLQRRLLSPDSPSDTADLTEPLETAGYTLRSVFHTPAYEILEVRRPGDSAPASSDFFSTGAI